MEKTKFLIPLLFLLFITPSAYAFEVPVVSDFWNTLTGLIDTIQSFTDAINNLKDGISTLQETISGLNPFDQDDDVLIIPVEDNENTSAIGVSESELFDYSDINEKAIASLKNVTDKLDSTRSAILDYSVLDGSKGVGKISVTMTMKDTIYGYSVFPFNVGIYKPDTPAYRDIFHLEKVTWWVQDYENPDTQLYKYTKSYSFAQETGTVSDYAILKTPDTECTKVKSLLTSNVALGEIDEIIDSKYNNFEVYVTIEGYIENWYEITVTMPDGSKSTRWVRGDDIPVLYKLKTKSVSTHLRNGYYDLDGAVSSYPVKDAVKYNDRWVSYSSRNAGSTSNLLGELFSVPVHVKGSSSPYQFYLLYNSKLSGFTNTVPLQDVRVRYFSVAVNNNSNYLITGNSYSNNIDMSGMSLVSGNIPYSDTESIIYKTYGVVYGEIVRSDGVKLPVWLIIRPNIDVVDPEYSVLDNDEFRCLEDLYSSDSVNETEFEAQKELALAKLEELIELAEYDSKHADSVGNTLAKISAESAIESLNKAKSILKSLSLSDENKEQKWDRYEAYLKAGECFLKAYDLYILGLNDEGDYYFDMGQKLYKDTSALVLSDDSGFLSGIISYIPGGWITVILALIVVLNYFGVFNSK